MIPQTFEESFERVKQLVGTFQANETRYRSAAYREAEVRQDFIDKFWIALGWDVSHEVETNPYQQRVKVERDVRTGAGRKRADYTFLAANFRDILFYVEAKSPQDIDTKNNYFQTIRYGWNSKTPLAVLTDFENLRVLDCRYKPEIDAVIERAVRKFHYTDYADEKKFREVYHLLSFEDVNQGAIDRFVETLPKPSRRAQKAVRFDGNFQSIDESFLADLDQYREDLAGSFKRRNPGLDSEELTEVTQRTLDRLVFMRFLEDKLIEPEPLVENLGRKGSAWQGFVAESRRLDGIYNGIIFKRHSILDSSDFVVDERRFEKISANLAHTNSPYDFNAIPIHILGSIYERFLGKVIVATAKRATVEERPEVRKAGGVYYTPQYIVTYIVENTVGKLIEGKSPEQIAEMRFADIACGSGSFLLGVYDLLLRYHTAYFNRPKNRPKALRARCIELAEGSFQLSLRQKKDILLNNIYGVDLDAQAVEVAQLSLYLKLLEDETTASARAYQQELHQTMLPSLDKNIVHGNALIGWDILDGQLFDEEQRSLVPLDFDERFKDIMRGGGFDAIVGNPPYIRIQTLQETTPQAVDYFNSHYKSAGKGSYDIYVVFVERALSLLNPTGVFGYILPHKFLNAKYGAALRAELARGSNVSHIVHFGDQQIFAGATTYTCLLFLNRHATQTIRVIRVEELSSWRESGAGIEGNINAQELSESEWNLAVGPSAALFERLSRMQTKLGNVATRIYQGPITSADAIYLFKDHHFVFEADISSVFSKELDEWIELETEILKPVVRSGDIHRYDANFTAVVLFPYEVQESKARLFTSGELQSKFPKAWTYLNRNKKTLENRENKQFKDAAWYRFGRTQNLGLWEQPKLMLPYMITNLTTFFDQNDGFYFINVTTGGYGILLDEQLVNYEYVCALLNSRLLDFYLKRVSTTFHGGYFAANKQYIEQLPIKLPNSRTSENTSRCAHLQRLVRQIMQSKKQLNGARTDRDKALFQGKCAALDRQIDALVYELYELTADEIAIVESSNA